MAYLLPYIDRNRQPATATRELPEPPKSINTASKTALVVANESLVTMFRRYFEAEGYTMRMASNTEEGMRLYRDFAPFNVVIIEFDAPLREGVQVDYLLPQTSGKNLAADILHLKPQQGIIFAAPAYRSPDDLCLSQELMQIPVLIDISIFELRTLLSPLEARRAIDALTEGDRLRLGRSASYRIWGLGRAARNRTAEDLLGEAQLRTLTGDRRWNRKIDFIRHLEGAMQSIAHGWKKNYADRETCLFTEISKPNAEGEDISPLENLASGEAAADQSLIAKQEVDAIFSRFADDREAAQVLQGWYDDLKPNEIRQKYGLDDKRFAAARKRIRLKLSAEGVNGGDGDGI
jgi:hypothetical protein